MGGKSILNEAGTLSLRSVLVDCVVCVQESPSIVIVGQSSTGKSALARQLEVLKGCDAYGNLRTREWLYQRYKRYRDSMRMIPGEFILREGTGNHAAVMQAILASEDPRTGVGLFDELQLNVVSRMNSPATFGLHLSMLRYFWNIPKIREVLTLAHEAADGSEWGVSSTEWSTDLKRLFRIWERTGADPDKFTLQDCVSSQRRSVASEYIHMCYNGMLCSIIDYCASDTERRRLPVSSLILRFIVVAFDE